MSALIRVHEWAATPLGGIETWPQIFKTAVDICLGSALPGFVWWGPDLIQLHNDAALAIMRSNRLGVSAREIWSDAWPALDQTVNHVMATGDPTTASRIEVSGRNEAQRQTIFDFHCSALRNDDGKVAGVLITAIAAGQKEAARIEGDSSDHVEAAADGIDDLIIIADSAAGCVFANASFKSYTGHDSGALAGDGWLQALHTDDVGACRAALRDAVSRRTVFRAELRLRRRDGGHRWFLCCGMPQVQSAEPMPCWVITCFDIDDEKRANDDVRESERRLLSFFENAAVGACQIDLSGRFTFVNGRYCEITGYSRDELVGKMGPLDLDHPDDAESDRPRIAGLLRGDGAYDCEKRYVRKDGCIAWVHVAATPIRDERGAVVTTAAVVEDITKQKLAESALQRFAALVESSSEFIGMCDMQLVPFYVNAAGLELVGFGSLDEARRASVLDFFFPEDRAFIREELLPRVQRDGRGEIEIRFRHFKSGEALWVIYSVVALKDEYGKPIGYGTVSRDITKRKLSEEALSQAEERQTFLLRLSDMLRPLNDTDLIERTATEMLGNHLGVAQVHFGHMHAASAEIRVEYRRSGGQQSYIGHYPFSEWLKSIEILRSGNPLVMRDVRASDLPNLSEDERARWASVEIRSHATVPILRQGQLVAALSICDTAPRIWTPRELEFLRDTAERTWAAIERIRAAAVARSADARYRAFVLASSDVVYRMSADWTQMLYLEGRGVLIDTPQPTEDWMKRYIYPGDQPDLRVAIEKAIRTKSLFELEHRVRRADGTIGWTMSRAVPIVDESGEITEWLGAARDVSTRREAEDQLRGREERLRLALGAGRMAIWDWDIQQNTLRWNDEHYRMLGFEPGSVTPSYKLLMSRIFPGDAPKLEGFIRNTLNSRAECVSEFRLLGKDDVPRWVEVHGRVELDSEGMPSLYGVVVDVTERKRAEEARAQSQRMEALGQLTGGIAHDYNNLLGVIAGHLEMAGPRITDARAQMAVRQALDAVMMGASLNRRLLSFSRRRKLTPQVCNLNERIADMLPLLQRSLGEPIKLSTALDQSLWPTRIDPGEINSALINLAHNARDAMTAGGQLTIATANISLDADEAARLLDALPGDYVRLTIADTGHGMPPDVLARAIEPFFTTKEMGKGTGLGLSSVYGFCTQSGGFLSMTSTPGEGTTVSLYLPRSEADEGTSMTVPAPDRIPMGDGELILVVEDNDRLREVASSLLESLDYTVLEARSGPEAVEILETEEPVALVFSDVVMPGGMSGYDVAQWLEAKKHNAKIVLTSGYNDTEQSEPSTTVGITVLAKPYNREQLSRAIDSALHAR